MPANALAGGRLTNREEVMFLGGMVINAVAVVQEFYRAMGAGDVEHIAALLSPDLEWTGAESFPYYNGLWRGPQAVIDNLLLPLARDWDGFSATRTNFSLAERFWIT